MKKSFLAILLGVFLGVMMMVGVIAVLNMKPDNEEMKAQGKEDTEYEDLFEEVFLTEDLGVLEEITEVEMVDSETAKKTVVTKVDYPYYIRVNRQANCVTIYTKDANGEYTVPVRAMTCSVGLTGETPLGITKITARYQWRPLFGGTYGQYTVRFNGHILFHSVPYTQPSKDALMEGQFNMLGEPASQGCVRLSAIDAKWIFDNCRNGTKVEVYDSPDPGPLGKPATYKVALNSPYRGWDPTDPDPANPWKQGTVSLTGVKAITVKQGEEIDLKEGVSATDVDGLPLSVEVNSVDTNVPGTYKVTYRATGVLGMTAMVETTVTVQAVSAPGTSEGTGNVNGTEDTGNTGNIENTDGTGNAEDSGNTGETGSTEDTENVGGTGSTENSGNTEGSESTEYTESTEGSEIDEILEDESDL